MGLELASGERTIAVDPDRGAKITSLRGADGFEWLTTTPARVPDHPGQLSFVDAEMYGWDECAPTINPGTLPDGRRMGGHGDVWDQPWTVVVHHSTELTTQITVDHLGFGLRRQITTTPTGFRFDYSAWATDERTLPLLWVAHPQFAAPPGTRVEVPGLRRVVQVHPNAAPIELDWDEVPQPATRSVKYWASDPELPRTAHLVRGDHRLVLGWQGAALRGMALWFDIGDVAAQPCVAIEPATGLGDCAVDLEPGREVAELVPGQPVAWSLTVDC